MAYNIYSALGNKVRVKLILCLSKNAKNVTELIKNCGLSQSAVSQHLSKLKSAKLVTTTKDGKEMLYKLTNKKIVEVCRLLQILNQEIK